MEDGTPPSSLQEREKEEDTLMIILTRFLDPGSPGCPGGPGGPGMATAKTKRKREVNTKADVNKD